MRRSQRRGLCPLQLTTRLVPIIFGFFNVPAESLEGATGNFAHPSSSLQTQSASASKRPASDPNFLSSVKKTRVGVSVAVQPIPELLRELPADRSFGSRQGPAACNGKNCDNLASRSQNQYQLSQVLGQQHPAVSMSGSNARNSVDLMSTSDTLQPASDAYSTVLEPRSRLKQIYTEPRPDPPQPASDSQLLRSPGQLLRIDTVPQHNAADYPGVYQKTESALTAVRCQFELTSQTGALQHSLLEEYQDQFSVRAEAAHATCQRLDEKSTSRPFKGVPADLITFAEKTGQAPIILLKPKSSTSRILHIGKFYNG